LFGVTFGMEQKAIFCLNKREKRNKKKDSTQSRGLAGKGKQNEGGDSWSELTGKKAAHNSTYHLYVTEEQRSYIRPGSTPKRIKGGEGEEGARRQLVRGEKREQGRDPLWKKKTSGF